MPIEKWKEARRNIACEEKRGGVDRSLATREKKGVELGQKPALVRGPHTSETAVACGCKRVLPLCEGAERDRVRKKH